MVVAVFAVAGCEAEEQPSPLPPYTPSPADLDQAYTTALADLEAALQDLRQSRDSALSVSDIAPIVAVNAVEEAKSCDTPIDALDTDPRDTLRSPFAAIIDPLLQSARDAPRSVAHDLAAAHVASPADREAVDEALYDYMFSRKDPNPYQPGPVFQAYLDRLGRDPALTAYLSAIDTIHDDYFPVRDIYASAANSLITAIIEAPDTPLCGLTLFAILEVYLEVWDEHRAAFYAYFDAYGRAIADYRDAIEQQLEYFS